MRRSGLLVGLILLNLSCKGVLLDTFDACDISGTLVPTSGLAGDTVRVSGGPFTTTWDTIIQVDGAQAEILDISFDGDCTDCLICKDSEIDCTQCDEECVSCVESIGFIVPNVSSGDVSVVLTNAYGSTGSIPFQVVGNPTFDTQDSGKTLPLETGVPHTGISETGPLDTGVADTGATDTGAVDTGPTDTGVVDTAAPIADTATDTATSPN